MMNLVLICAPEGSCTQNLIVLNRTVGVGLGFVLLRLGQRVYVQCPDRLVAAVGNRGARGIPLRVIDPVPAQGRSTTHGWRSIRFRSASRTCAQIKKNTPPKKKIASLQYARLLLAVARGGRCRCAAAVAPRAAPAPRHLYSRVAGGCGGKIAVRW